MNTVGIVLWTAILSVGTIDTSLNVRSPGTLNEIWRTPLDKLITCGEVDFLYSSPAASRGYSGAEGAVLGVAGSANLTTSV